MKIAKSMHKAKEIDISISLYIILHPSYLIALQKSSKETNFGAVLADFESSGPYIISIGNALKW